MVECRKFFNKYYLPFLSRTCVIVNVLDENLIDAVFDDVYTNQIKTIWYIRVPPEEEINASNWLLMKPWKTKLTMRNCGRKENLER